MVSSLRGMPGGVRFFLAYAFVILALIGLTLPLVVSLAIDSSVAFAGVVVMMLLAYTIFTITLALQRKQAAWVLSQGLATLTIPLIPFLGYAAGVAGALFAAVLAVLLFRGLRSSRARAWFSEV